MTEKPVLQASNVLYSNYNTTNALLIDILILYQNIEQQGIGFIVIGIKNIGGL